MKKGSMPRKAYCKHFPVTVAKSRFCGLAIMALSPSILTPHSQLQINLGRARKQNTFAMTENCPDKRAHQIASEGSEILARLPIFNINFHKVVSKRKYNWKKSLSTN